MPDDLKQRGVADRKRISQQPHEQAHQKRKPGAFPADAKPGKKDGRGADPRKPPVTREDTED